MATPPATARAIASATAARSATKYTISTGCIVRSCPERDGLAPTRATSITATRDLQLYARFDSHAGPGISNAWDASAASNRASTAPTASVRVLTYRHRGGRRPHPDHPSRRPVVRHLLGCGRGRLDFLSSTGGGIAFAEYAPHGAPSALHRVNAATGLGGRDSAHRIGGHYFFGGGGAGTGGGSDALHRFGQCVTRDNPAFAWNGHYRSRLHHERAQPIYQAGGAAFTYDRQFAHHAGAGRGRRLPTATTSRTASSARRARAQLANHRG